MNTKSSRKAWVILLKESVLPLIIGAVLFILFWLIYERYGTYYKEYLDKISVALFIFLITYWVFKISVALFNWYATNIAAKTKSELDDKFIPLFKRTAVAVIWVIGIIMVLSRLGININALVATLGVGSLAIALAAQDTIANIIAGFLIMIDRPFCIGDCIRLPSGEKVKVLDIGIRRTKFVSEEKAIIIVPNLDLSKSKIVNYTYGEEWKRNTER
jgi:MscS family membrane protein